MVELSVAAATVVAYVIGVLITPEAFEFLTAGLITLNTYLLIRHARSAERFHHRTKRIIDERLEPKLDEVRDVVTHVDGVVDRRRLDRPDGDHDGNE